MVRLITVLLLIPLLVHGQEIRHMAKQKSMPCTFTSRRSRSPNTHFSSFKGSINDKRNELVQKFRLPKKLFSLHVDRDRVLTDLMKKSISLAEFKKQWVVQFDGEQPSRALKEYMSLFSNAIMDPHHGVFLAKSPSRVLLKRVREMGRFPHEPSHVARLRPGPYTRPYLDQLTRVGEMMGMSILNKQLIDVTFTSCFYKYILGKQIGLPDIKELDPHFYTDMKLSVQHLRTKYNTPLKMTYYNPNTQKHCDLVPDGWNVHVTHQSKRLYVDSVVDLYVQDILADAMNAICVGLFRVIPRKAFAMFDANELEILISGDANVDLYDWIKIYRSPGHANEQLVRWFWRCVHSWDLDMRSRLFIFVTGNYRLPMGGFKNARKYSGMVTFNIQWVPTKLDIEPIADPHSNTLYLPSYTSYDSLKENLETAVWSKGGVATWYAAAERSRHIAVYDHVQDPAYL